MGDKATPLEDQAEKDAQKLRGKGKGKGSTAGSSANPQDEKYGRKKGDSLGGGLKAGAYRKQTVDDTLPGILQKLIDKERQAREIIESKDASRYRELPNIYGSIRELEAKRDKVIKQVSNPVDDNKDTDYVVKQYNSFLEGKPAHFSASGKKAKHPFSSDGKAYTEDEIKFAMTKTAVVPGLNKAGLATKQQTRDRLDNSLALSGFSQGQHEKAVKTKAEEEKMKETTPEDRSKKRAEIEEEGYRAYKTNEFNDDGSVKTFSRDYETWLSNHASGKGEETSANARFGKRYKKEDYKPPTRRSDPPATKKTSTATKTKTGVRGGRRNPATSSSTGSTKRAVGMPNDASTRKNLATGDNTKADVIAINYNNVPADKIAETLNAQRVEYKEKKGMDTVRKYDDILIGTAFVNMGDPDWLATNPPGSEEYEKNKNVLNYYTSIGVEPQYQFPDAPSAPTSEGSSSTGASGEKAQDPADKHPTSEGVKSTATDADGDATGGDGSGDGDGLQTPPVSPKPYKTVEEKQEEADKDFPKTKTTDAPRPGTVEEFDVLEADRGMPPAETPMPAPGVSLTPSQIAKARSDDVAQENKQRGKASIKRLKEEIRAYHLVYDNNIKEFRENPHKKQKDDALKSNNIEVVRAHHKKMEEKIREYYRSGDADSLNVGVIVPIDTYLQQYLSRSVPQMSNIQPPMTATTQSTVGASHRHQHLTKKGHDPFGHSIAASTYYQRGGIQSYKQQPVANHTIRIKGKVNSAPIADPKVYVDAPMNNFLQRPLKLKSSLKIKS